MEPAAGGATDHLSRETLRIVDDFWAADVGCTRDMLRSADAIAVPHPEQYSEWTGIFILLVGAVPIISLPRALYPSMLTRAQDWVAAQVLDETYLRSSIGLHVDKIIGPAFIGYVDRRNFQPIKTSLGRLLRKEDTEQIAALRAACDPADWEHGGREPGENPAIGCFASRELVALAGYDIWTGGIAHISIVTHPLYRRKGYGRAAVSRLTEIALDRGLVPQYRTLDSNESSIKIASKLGFTRYATTMTVQLRSDA